MRWPIVLLFVLVGCASPQRNAGPDLLGAETWRLHGKLGIRAPAYSGSVSIDWQNSDERFNIALTGAFGVSVARIEGGADTVTLRLPGEPPVEMSPNQLRAYLGYDLPLGHLHHWVRGGADPDRDHESQDAGFSQAGWHVEYLRYSSGNPVKMRLTRDTTRLTLVVRSWDY